MGKIVRYELDPENPPELTKAQKAEIAELKSRPESNIDFSDIPGLTETFWKNAVRNPYYRPRKQQLTLRLDADLVAWFKQHTERGRGYQTGINNALRDYVEQQEKKAG